MAFALEDVWIIGPTGHPKAFTCQHPPPPELELSHPCRVCRCVRRTTLDGALQIRTIQSEHAVGNDYFRERCIPYLNLHVSAVTVYRVARVWLCFLVEISPDTDT